MFGSRFLKLVLVFALLVPVATRAWAEDKNAAPKYVTVPVYYLTDRNLDGDTYGNSRRYKNACLHQMYYGTAFVTVENSKRLVGDEHFSALGWKAAEDKGKGPSPKDRIDPELPLPAKHAFFDRLGQAMDKRHTENLCVFVHGAAESFEDAVEDAAEMAYNLQLPLVLYSWPSEPKMLDYVVDNGNSEWSQGHFNIFCRDLNVFKQTHPVRLILLAHSMGNRFIFRAVPSLYHKELIGDCELMSPDIDFDTCRHYLMGFGQVDSRVKVRLYVSDRDKMLKLSQKLFGGYSRLGEDVDASTLPKLSEQPAADKDDPYAIPEQGLTRDYVDRIDFTAIDKGLTGHSIPFELVADMVNHDKAGHGLELIGDTSDTSKSPIKIVRKASQVEAEAKR